MQEDCGDDDNHQLGVIITTYDEIEVLGCLKFGGDHDVCWVSQEFRIVLTSQKCFRHQLCAVSLA